MMVTTSTMRMKTIFGAPHKAQAFISLNAFPAPGSTPRLHRQTNWIRTEEPYPYTDIDVAQFL